MLRKFIAQKTGFPLQDLFTGTSILETFSFLNESQWWSKEKMDEYRLGKLKKLVQYSYSNVPFYREEFDRIRLKPSDICTLDDIRKIPVVTKDTFRSRNFDFVARGGTMRHVRIGKTGGTTGPPIIVYKDQYDRTFTWASYYRWYNWMGLEMGDKSLTLWGARNVTRFKPVDLLKTSLINYLQNAIVVNSFEIRKENMHRVIERLNSSNPSIIKGYLSALLFLAEYMEEKGLTLTSSPVALSSTTETLFPHNREYLERIFRAPVYDQYGCGEVSAIAYECSHHKGMHLTQEHVITEVLDDSWSPVKVKGNIVVTNLDNYAMPFIRYSNGDLATLSDEECTCGVKLPLLTSVDGRSSDVITLKNGERVHGVFFTDILYEKGVLSDKIRRFQVYQAIPGEIEFRIECSAGYDPDTDRLLDEAMRRYFNKVEIIRKERLENEANGKFKYIKLA